MNISVIEEPATEPLSLEDVKKHIRVEHTEDDTLISALIVAAREYCEGYLNRALITQTRKLSVSRWPILSIKLPGGLIQSISSVEFINFAGETLTVPETDYYLTDSGEMAKKQGVSWPSVSLRGPESIHITYVCGYGNAEDVPTQVKQALLLLIGSWYERREGAVDKTMQEIPFGVKELLCPIREIPV